MSKTTENYGFTKPEVGEFFSLETWNGNMDNIDGELKKRENAQKESDISLMNPEFTEAKERKNLTSGEKIHLMLGKISKFFSDMKAIAFSGSYNDLADKPKIPTVLNNQTTTVEGYALDARQANPNIDGTLAKQVADLNGSFNKRLIGNRFFTTDTTTITDIKNFIFENLDTGITYMNVYDEKGKFFGTGGNWFIIALAQDNVSAFLLAINHWGGGFKILGTYKDSSDKMMLKIFDINTTYSKDI